MAATSASAADLAISGAALRWHSIGTVQYGFCGECGSTLFWRATDEPERVSIAAGTLDPPTRLSTKSALFTADASDYHRLDHSLIEYPRDH